jgi:hypothetical protein
MTLTAEQLNSDHEELRLLLARSSEGNGWDEPGMEAHDSYPKNTMTRGDALNN